MIYVIFLTLEKFDEWKVNLLTLDSVMLNNAHADVTVISDASSH